MGRRITKEMKGPKGPLLFDSGSKRRIKYVSHIACYTQYIVTHKYDVGTAEKVQLFSLITLFQLAKLDETSVKNTGHVN